MSAKKKAAKKRPKPGSVIERTYKRKKLTVQVTANGFRYRGKEYASLTAVALAITGAKSISGPYFFRNAKRKAKGKVQ